ncbi:MAG: sugar ABC transporter substrate-binding protein [Armatimonadota bacterium]|nr:sugar ABC transporter substrate-binding protein [Armatimonadota bacterium]
MLRQGVVVPMRILAVSAVMLTVGLIPPAWSGEAVTLRFSNWHLVETVWGRSLREAIAIFESQNPGIRIAPEPISYAEKEPRYQAECAARRMPDVVKLHNFSLTMFFELGCAADLTPFVQKEGPEFLKTWYETPIKTLTYKGKLLAMPGDFMSMVLIYNRELFRAAGLDPGRPPRNWTEFLDYARRLTRDTDGDGRIDQWGFSIPASKNPGLPLRIAPVVWSFGADFLTPDGRRSALDTREFREAFTYIVELATVHRVVPPGVTTFGPGDVRTQMAHRRVAMKMGSGWSYPIINDINPALKAYDALEAAPVPVGRKQVTMAWLSGWIMSPHTRHPEAAWKFIKFLTSKETEKKFFFDNRVISSRKDVNTLPMVQTDKFSKMIVSQLQYARLEPLIPEWPEIFDAFATALQEAITGAKTPDRALADAHARVNTILGAR